MKYLKIIVLILILITPFYATAAVSISNPVKPEVSKVEYRKALKSYKSEIKGLKNAEKKKFVLDKIYNTKAKTYRLPLLLSAIGLLLTGALIIFLAYSTIGYLGFIIGVIGIIALTVWLIFKEGENL